MGLKDKYREAWHALIKPVRFQFPREALGLPRQMIDNNVVIREDFRVKNCDGFTLEGSFYRPENIPASGLNIVMYLHTRGGSRLEGTYLSNVLLPRIGLVVFDFAGSGYSGGEYITLGIKEARDVRLVLDHIKSKYNIAQLVVWGRSMGAVAAILFAAEKANRGHFSGLILDAPFSSFKRMVYDVITCQKNIPLCFIDAALYFILKTIKHKTGEDLSKIEPIKAITEVRKPAFFIVGHNDIISRPDKVKDLYLGLNCDVKEFHLVQGEHNSQRERSVVLNAVYFILKCFNNPGLDTNVETRRHSHAS